MARISEFAKAYHRKRSTELMTHTCQIIRPGPSKVTYNNVTRVATSVNGTVIYSGACTAWEAPGGSPTIVSDDELIITQSWVSIPYNAASIEPGDVCMVTRPGEPNMTGKVISVPHGGRLRGSTRFSVQYVDEEGKSW